MIANSTPNGEEGLLVSPDVIAALLEQAVDIALDGARLFKAFKSPYDGRWHIRNYGGDHFCLVMPAAVPADALTAIIAAFLKMQDEAYRKGGDDIKFLIVQNMPLCLAS